MTIQYIFLDFGGCIDSPGIHTRALFFQEFLAAGALSTNQKSAYQEAYSRADKKMMADGSAKHMGLKEFNRFNAKLICADLDHASEAKFIAGADAVTAFQEKALEHNQPILQKLSKKAQLGIISNFTGNLEVILREFGLHRIFHSITESFYVGSSKPDEYIFLSALKKQNNPAENCLFVGDNPVNDIAPGKKLGMKTALIHLPGEKRDVGADYYISDLSELEALKL